MSGPYVIAVNAVAGGGKTALTNLLAASLPNAVLFSFDDLDDGNALPDDLYEWMKRGSNLSEFDCSGTAKAVESELKREAAEFIVLDYPFGRDHSQFPHKIDLSVFIDTPLDVALARRILRDQKANSDEKWEALTNELTHYLDRARYVYLHAYRRKDSCDLVLDGTATLESLKEQVLDKLKIRK